MPETQTERDITARAERAASRAPRQASDPNDLESAVLKEVSDALSKHPSVIFCVRQNGGMVESNGTPVFFYRWVRRPQPMVLTDFWGFVRGYGRVGTVPLAIECKRRGWRMRDNMTAREAEQYAFICFVRSMGGIGGFVTSAQEALDLLNGEGK
jgi:hypothetical protein